MTRFNNPYSMFKMMSVSDGQDANAATFNGAFVSKTIDDSKSGKLDLTDSSSTDVIDVQGTINTNKTDISTNSTDIATNQTNITTNQGNITTNATESADIRTTQGTANGDTDLGTFTGATISDNTDVKTALGELESAVEAIPSGIVFKGNWDASTNTPTLSDNGGGGATGDRYTVSVAGSTSIDGETDWQVGDYITNIPVDGGGNVWQKTDNTDTVTSVFSRTGAVVAQTNDYTWAQIDKTTAPINDLSDVNISSPADTEILTYSGGNWVNAAAPSGGGGSGEGGINYITNPDAETDTSDWATYDDGAVSAPVDGTGGSPSGVTLTRITTGQLRGTGSFRVTKSLGDFQGEGVSTDFSIDPQDENKILNLSFDYTTSASYSGVNNTLKVFIYDVDNAALITPFENEISSGTYTRYTTRFQATDSANYRLIFHVSVTTVDSYFFDYDRVSVGPDVVVPGAIVTEWEQITNISSLIPWTTNSTHSAYKRRVGDTMEVEVRTALSGAPNAATYTITIPDGLSIDTSKQSTNTITGYAYLEDNSTAGNRTMAQIQILDANTVRPIAIGGSTVTQAAPFTWANNDKLVTNFRVPIDGWSAGASLSTTEALFGTPVLEAENSSGDVFNDTAPIQSWTTIKDNTNSFNASSGVYTVPSSGDYLVSTSYLILSGNTSVATIYVNGSLYRGGPQSTTSKSKTITTIVSDLVAGDTIDIRGSSGTNATLNGSATWNSLSIHKLQDLSVFSVYGSKQIVYLKDVKAANTAGGTFTSGSWQTRTLNTIEGDSSMVSLSTNQFTLGPGKYSIEATAPAQQVNNHKIKLRNITNSSDDIIGSSSFCVPGTSMVTESDLYGELILSESTTFELQHRSTATKATDGYGIACNMAVAEVYAQVKIERLA